MTGVFIIAVGQKGGNSCVADRAGRSPSELIRDIPGEFFIPAPDAEAPDMAVGIRDNWIEGGIGDRILAKDVTAAGVPALVEITGDTEFVEHARLPVENQRLRS